MEALSLLPINTLTNNHISLSASSNYVSLSSSLQLNPSVKARTLTLVFIHSFFLYRGLFCFLGPTWNNDNWVSVLQRKSLVRVQAENEDYELKQVRDMAAARKRWEALVFFNFINLFFSSQPQL